MARDEVKQAVSNQVSCQLSAGNMYRVFTDLPALCAGVH